MARVLGYVRSDPSLQSVDTFNYLKVQLCGEAREANSGLDITGSNYEVAVKLLNDRYGRRHLMIDAHYSHLRDLPSSNGYYSKLRVTYDVIEKHLRSLESLGENVENNMIVSLVK